MDSNEQVTRAGLVQTAENTITGIEESILHAPEIFIKRQPESEQYSVKPKDVSETSSPANELAKGMKGAVDYTGNEINRINEQASHTKDDFKHKIGDQLQYHGESSKEMGKEMKKDDQVDTFGSKIRNLSEKLNPFQ
jgi:hypothetical protein